jgi:hypothetical protein
VKWEGKGRMVVTVRMGHGEQVGRVEDWIAVSSMDLQDVR